ncbi:histone acetyltransferases subunit 3-domain-containing protein [Chaetomium tenue]|uniref:Histone acetyltransferases subunit 3-domain-containing protein n=1 Tax=Chaetomium tenue TaxID=1854479 RepID=A0ACB7PPF0_9PEZI|nr:histone acetyltransferases subunit 3-domain-containing protein [Chaetomium globosum]
MAPSSSQKGTGKKGGASAIRQQQQQQQQRSRNTTPGPAPPSASLPPFETIETETIELRFDIFRNLTFEDMVDPPASSTPIPDSKSLDGILTRLQRLGDVIEKRGSHCDRGMRLLAQTRKQRVDELTMERGREEERRQRAADDGERERKSNKKKRKGADSLAPHAGNTERSSPLRDSTGKARKLSRGKDSASSSLSPVAPRTPSNMDVDDKAKTEANDDDSSSDDGRPPPPARPQANTFGDDPSTFPDPTVYEILPVQPGMTEDEIKEIYSVAGYPKSDLADLIAGDPPDKDFSSAKPSNQINFSTFSTYIEPYFRPFTEEDLAFLRERGDRMIPFVMPKRGKRHYMEIWAEEDGGMAIDSSPPGKLPPNQARGNIESMDDEVAETDKLSVGPLLSRLLQAMRPEHRAPPAEDKPSGLNGVGGDGDGTNGVTTFDFSFGDNPPTSQSNGGANGVNGTPSQTNADLPPQPQALPAATYMPESNSEPWKKATHPKLDYTQVDERIKQELRHIGFLPLLSQDAPNTNGGSSSNNPNGTNSSGPGGSSNSANNGTNNHNGSSSLSTTTDPAATAEYDGHYDDEVAARMRLLQARLREQVLVNGARKARLTDLVKERMAFQEYQTILEDLDSQVQAAYLKRTRTMGKKPKKARPGQSAAAAAAAAAASTGAGGAGMARPGIGDLTRTVMERRRRWIDNIGTVFDDEGLARVPRVRDPDSTIFKPGEMGELMTREREAWDEEVEEE